MTDRGAHAWGATIVVAGGVLGAAAALWMGRPGSLWRPLAIGLTAYVATGMLVLRWGLEVYGPRGALAAVGLCAFAPCVLAALAAPPQVAPAGGTTLLGGFAQLVAAYTLMRCVLDPTFQWALVAGLAIATVPVGAFLHGSPGAAMAGLGAFSLAAVVARTVTAGRCEDRVRVVRGGAVAVGLAWAVAVGVALVVFAASHLPSVGEYVDAPRRSLDSAPAVGTASATRGAPGASIIPAVAIDGAAGPERGVPRPVARTPALGQVPFAALLLTAMRPWRRQRRFTDTGLAAALLCLGAPLWLAWGEPGGVFMAPIAALLAGACWDEARPRAMRRMATAVVGLQIVVALLLWPRFPGGVRADAWLPSPDVSPAPPAGEP